MEKIFLTRFRPWLACFGIGFAVAVTVFGLRSAGILQFLELATYDFYLSIGQKNRPLDSRFVIVGISERDVRRYGHPLPDRVLALLLTTLLERGATTVGVDIYRDLPQEPGHQQLQALLASRPELIFIHHFGDGQVETVPPPPALQEAWRFGEDAVVRAGFNDLVEDPDGIVRRGLLFLDDGEQVFASFSLLLARHYLGDPAAALQPAPDNPAVLRLGATVIPPLAADDGAYVDADPGGYQFLLDYQGLAVLPPSVDIQQVLSKELPDDYFQDKLVLIGTMAASINDAILVPFQPRNYPSARVRGVQVQGLITAQLLRFALGSSQPRIGFAPWVDALWGIVWSLVGAVVALRVRSLSEFLLRAGGGLLVIVASTGVVFAANSWLPVVAPGLGWLLAVGWVTAYQASREQAERRVLMQLFSRHVSADVASMLWQQREKIFSQGRLLPRRVTATVLFTDLQGFTEMSEYSDPEVLMEWLNDYMETMALEVFRYNGVIDKFIGDAIMAVFGVPIASRTPEGIARDAVNAVACALAMSQALTALNQRWADQGKPTVVMRVGIYTGSLVAGTLGGGQRFDYTVIGDTVNTAARLESYDKSIAPPPGMPCRILVGEATLNYLQGCFVTEAVGSVRLKGKDQAVSVHSVSAEVARVAVDDNL